MLNNKKMNIFQKLIRSFWPFIGLVILTFMLGVGFNVLMQVPAEGVKRLYAFAPLALLCVLKARTMRE